MNKLNISGEHLKAIGFPEGKSIGTAIKIIDKHYRNHNREEVLALLAKLLENPEIYKADEIMSPIVTDLLAQIEPEEDIIPEISLKDESGSFAIYGGNNIEQGAINQ